MTTANPIDVLLPRLRGVRKNGTGWLALCAGHDDRSPSLSIHVGDDGRVLLRCFAGCEPERIVGALGLTLADLFPPREGVIRAHRHDLRHCEPSPQPLRNLASPRTSDSREPPQKRAVKVRRWPIRDASGRVAGVHVRTDYPDGSKGVAWERPDGRLGLGGLSSKDLPLYGIHERRPGQATIVVEGEPARDAVASLAAQLDVAVVSTVTGASAEPDDESLRPLLDGHVLLWPDSDEPGETHMDKVHWRLRELDMATDAIHRIAWDGARPGEGDDAADFVAQGRTAEELQRFIAAAPQWAGSAGAAKTPEQTRPIARLVTRSLADVTPQPIDWLWLRWLALGKLHLFAGHPGDGKSTLAAWIAATGSRGGTWPDGTSAPRFRTLFVLGEDSLEDTLRPRLDLFEADVAKIRAVETVLDEQGRERFFDVSKHLDQLEDAVVAYGITLLVIDPLSTTLVGSDRNAEGDMRDRLTPLVKLAERRNLAVLGIGHVGKPTGTTRTPLQRILGSTGLGALARLVWMTAAAEECMAVGPVKSNLAIVPDALLWTRDEDGPIEWHGNAEKKLEALLDGALPRTPRADAEGFLRDYLAGGSKPSEEVKSTAERAGISWATLRRAADEIGILKHKATGTTDGRWFWRLPNGTPQVMTKSPHESALNLLTPLHTDVSKLSKLDSPNLLHGATREQVLTTTPISQESTQQSTEVAQLAHVPASSSEQDGFRNGATDADADVVETAKRLAMLTAEELAVYRKQVANASADDRHIQTDRKALALFEAMRTSGALA